MKPAHRWLEQLTGLPTTSGREDAVVDWVERWAARRDDVRLRRDGAGNLLLTLRGRSSRAPVIAAAHMDHPGFVVESADGRGVVAVFRGGVAHAYFAGARVECFDGSGGVHPGRVVARDERGPRVEIRLDGSAPLRPGDIGRWRFHPRSLGIRDDRLRAHACDDLAGVAAALAALDRARRRPSASHFGVLLTRAEEEGFIGAIAAAKLGTVPDGARVLSIETSRSFPDSPIGAGPVVRVGDASTVFDDELTNAVASVARASGLVHQRRLMAGGSCEATAFGAYGIRATGLCLPLGNYHNMVDIDGVAAGTAEPAVGPEEISLADFDGLVALLLRVAEGIDDVGGTLVERLDARYEANRSLLG